MARSKSEVPFVKVQRLIKGYGISAAELGRILDVSEPTARNRMKKPEDLTLGELWKICQRGHIEMAEIRERDQ